MMPNQSWVSWHSRQNPQTPHVSLNMNDLKSSPANSITIDPHTQIIDAPLVQWLEVFSALSGTLPKDSHYQPSDG